MPPQSDQSWPSNQSGEADASSSAGDNPPSTPQPINALPPQPPTPDQTPLVNDVSSSFHPQPIVAAPETPSSTFPTATPSAPQPQPSPFVSPAAPQPSGPGTVDPSAGSQVVVSSHAPTTEAQGGSFGSSAFTGTKKHGKKFTILLAALIVLVLGGGSAAAYFGYYMNPGVIWKQSLSNTNQGYSKLVGYLNTQSQTKYKGYTADGSFKVNSNGTNYNGTFSAQGDSSNSTTSTKLDLGVTNLGIETRSIQAAGNADPDVYLQISGFRGLLDSALAGSDLAPKVDALDGQWIVVDHNLYADLKDQITKAQSQSNTPQLTWSDVHSFLVSAGTVDQQYVFTTNKSKSVTTIVKNVGKETVDGHSTYHYKVGFVKANVKAYVNAMCTTLEQSKLGTYLTKSTGSTDLPTTCKNIEDSTDNIKSSDTIDVWVNMSNRLVYKVRVSAKTNPAENFVDVGMNYKGGNTFPFFINLQDQTSGSTEKLSTVATLDSSNNSLNVTLNASTTGAAPYSLSGTFTFKPSNSTVSVAAPANAEPLTTVLHDLGLDGYLNALPSLLSTSAQSSATGLSTSAPLPILPLTSHTKL